MSDIELDPFTADRLLSGEIPPEDAPPGYGAVARMVTLVKADASPAELGREASTVAAMAAMLGSRTARLDARRRNSRVFHLTRLKVVSAALVATLALGTGLAFAGSLPTSFQKVASSVLSKVGINVPGPDSHAGSHPNTNATAIPESAMFGLCTAWQSGQGGTNGKKDQATSFTRLSAAAGDLSVQDFCTNVIAQHNAAHSSANSNSGEPNTGTGTANTKSGGRSGTGLGHKP